MTTHLGGGNPDTAKRWRTAYDPGVTTRIPEYRLKSDALKVTSWVAYPLAPDDDGQPMRTAETFGTTAMISAPARPTLSQHASLVRQAS